jgi:glutamate synthase (ferredoxin)
MGYIFSKAGRRVASPASSLLDSRFDHDSCGVGFVANLRNQPSHTILIQALTALARLAHRGAIAADGKSSDGVGLMTGIPREFLLSSTGISLDREQPLAIGVVFLPADGASAKLLLEESLAGQQLQVLGWRVVPTRPEVLGEIALSSIPVIEQVLITAGDRSELERRLYLSRKQFERVLEGNSNAGYLCSLSTSCMVYKALCAGRLLADFYPDLADPAFVTRFAVFHQRYATNVLPSWHRAQPLRMLAHNGEINTIWGNRARMDARAATIPDEYHPIFTHDGSDSTSLDEVVELLARNGRSVAEAVRMLLPPAGRMKDSAFLKYHACGPVDSSSPRKGWWLPGRKPVWWIWILRR